MVSSVRVTFKNLFVVALATACSADSVRETKSGDTIVPASTRPSAPPELSRGRYVGKHYRHDSMPAGVTFDGGALLRIGGAEYSISHVRAGDVDMLWLDSIASRTKQSPEMVVRAELRIPPLERDERLFMASCDVGGHLDSRVVAIVVNDPGAKKFTKIRQAWRVDANRGRFDVIPVTGVTCEEPGT